MSKRLHPHIDRADIVAADRKRRDTRDRLKRDAAIARTELSPGYQINRLKTQAKNSARNAFDGAGKTVRRAAPFIGLAGLAALLFAGRKPIAGWISRVRTVKKNRS